MQIYQYTETKRGIKYSISVNNARGFCSFAVEERDLIEKEGGVSVIYLSQDRATDLAYIILEANGINVPE